MPGVFQGWGQAMRTTATLDDELLARAKRFHPWVIGEQACGAPEPC